LPGFADYPDKGKPPYLATYELNKPFTWKKPRRIFVESMGDLFHDDVPRNMIDRVLEVIAACPEHTFMVLTKRPENIDGKLYGYDAQCPVRELGGGDYLPNLWLGVTVENQSQVWRVGELLSIYSPVHFVSVEPMLERIDLDLCGSNYGRDSLNEMVNWVICGGETGPKARPMDPQWALDLLIQCLEAKVPFFFKRWSAANPKSLAMPREFPRPMEPHQCQEGLSLGEQQSGLGD